MEKFSVYPAGAQGAALLALRASLACALLLRLLPPAASILPPPILFALAAALLVGGFIRFTALGAGALATITPSGLDPLSAVHGLNAIALAILGAGAYSIDARLFGRRVIHIDHRKPPSLPDPKG